MPSAPPLVLAYAGSPGGPAAIDRLRAATRADVVTVTLDLGQGTDLEQVAAEARAAGALRAHVVDARERFAGQVLLPALRAGIAGGQTPPGPAAFARPTVAGVLVDVARMESATLVAHGASGDDKLTFDRLLADLAPDLRVAAVDGRDGPPVAPRVVSNLWGRAVVFPGPSDAWAVPGAALFTRTSAPASCENHQAIVELTFERGVPVAVSGIPMSFTEILEVVDTIAGDHGVGRTDTLRGAPPAEWREVGEAPAAAALAAALGALEQTTLDPGLVTLKTGLAPAYKAALEDGRWFSSTRRALDALVDSAMIGVTGTVRLMLFRGSCRVVGRTAGPSAVAVESVGIQPAI